MRRAGLFVGQRPDGEKYRVPVDGGKSGTLDGFYVGRLDGHPATRPAGKSKAQAAARVVGGKAVLPVFAPGEADYPAGLAPLTPQSYRAHLRATRALETTTGPGRKAELEKALLSKEQQTALTRIKRYTDFNDLATQSRLGREGVERQIRATVNKAVAEVKQKQQQGQQQAHKQQQRHTRHAAPI